MKQEKSFTLIEILVVIVVIGILSSFILVGMSSVSNSANLAKGQAYMNSIRNSLLISLVTEWKFDENTGTTTTDSWNNIVGTWNGSASANFRPSSECVSSYCIQFDGVDDYIEKTNVNTTPLYNITNEITVSAWFKRMGASGGTNASGWHGIVRSANGFNWYPRVLVSSSGGQIYLQYKDSSDGLDKEFTSTASLSFILNKWHYLTVTKGSYGVKIYFDGREVGSNSSLTGPMSNGSSSFLMGCGVTPLLHYMANGAIDNVLIYNSAISVSEIQETYYSGITRLLSKGIITNQEFLTRINNLLANNYLKK
ncbi:MAG: LamG domain-containing protein [Candidatus Pacebacteria bacterium]|nr:LamG domain-containing protein [Candidatus Paceibacterota bacterium]MDD5752970.1 LamG domain-containing protein [Candidatus Paceibacterota bacterium]